MSPPSSMLFKRILYMSILSDRQIKERCMKPSHYLKMSDGEYTPIIANATHTPEQVAQATERPNSRLLDATPEVLKQFNWKPMISPFVPESIRKTGNVKIISAGLSSFGYDVTLGREMKVFTNINSAIINPKQLDESCLVTATVQTDEHGSEYVILPPNSYLLGKTVEYFNIPRDVLVVCLGKSTYARAGAIVNCTPIEPGFKGNVVIEISNSTNLPMMIFVDEGIAQFLFFQGSEECEISYDDRGGKYQGQTTLQLPMV